MSLSKRFRDENPEPELEPAPEQESESGSDSASEYEPSDCTIVRPRKFPRLNRGSITLRHLPDECQDDFRLVFRPAIKDLAGTLAGPWDPPSQKDVILIWNKYFPTHQVDWSKSGYDRLREIVIKLADDTVQQWRRDIGLAAVEHLRGWLKDMFEKKQDRMAHASWMLGDDQDDRKRPYYYRDYKENSPPAGIFQSYIVAKTLATHLKSTSPLPKESRAKFYPAGALALTLLAINRALTWAKSGVSSIPRSPAAHFSRSNWGDQYKLKDGHYVFVKTSSNIVQVIKKLKDTQWTRIIAVAETYVPIPQGGEDEGVDGEAELESDFVLEDADECMH